MSYSEKIKDLFKKYGRVGLGVHLAIYAATISGCYIAAERNHKLEEFLVRHGLLSNQELKDDANPESRGWFTGTLTSSGSSLALAFICTKALLPIRVPLTLAITPPIARVLRGSSARAVANAATKAPPK